MVRRLRRSKAFEFNNRHWALAINFDYTTERVVFEKQARNRSYY
jgi:hypothetical protein